MCVCVCGVVVLGGIVDVLLFSKHATTTVAVRTSGGGRVMMVREEVREEGGVGRVGRNLCGT